MQNVVWAIFAYTLHFEKLGCLVTINIVKLDLDVSYDQNDPSLYLDPTFCLLLLIITKCNKLMIMKINCCFI